MASRRAVVLSMLRPHLERSSAAKAAGVELPDLAVTWKLMPLRAGSWVICSPKLVPRATPPSMKKGTSMPSCAPSSRNLSEERPRFQILLSAFKVAAAFEDPPPSPEARGIFLSI